MPGWPGVQLEEVAIAVDDDGVRVKLTVEASEEIPEAELTNLQERLALELNDNVALSVRVIPVIDLPPMAPSTPTPSEIARLLTPSQRPWILI